MTLKPARKSRTKTRKPKFLSLRLEITPVNTQLSGEMSNSAAPIRHQPQLNLFPLHPQNPAEDENVADFFAAADGGGDNLTTLLGGSSSEEHNALSPSLTYACCGAQDSEDGALVRTAMRSKERDAREEKWVCYEEVTSCAADHRYKVEAHRLSLKLDYQEILNAWSDKGPLYIHLEAPQRVPEVYDEFLACDPSSNGPNGGLWTVPENMSANMKVKREQEEEEEFKIGQREASVLRYKEKRHNRLFSKRIRYEVRKINAEKRPRMKGRFVKRS